MESSKLRESWLKKLYDFREQGLHISDVNPVSALAEHIEEEIYKGKINPGDLQNVINLLSAQIWQKTVKNLRMQTQVENSEKDKSVPTIYSKKILKIFKKAERKLVIVKNGDHSLSNKKNLKKIIFELNKIVSNVI